MLIWWFSGLRIIVTFPVGTHFSPQDVFMEYVTFTIALRGMCFRNSQVIKLKNGTFFGLIFSTICIARS